MRAYSLIVLEYNNMKVKNKSDLSRCINDIKEISAINSEFTSEEYVSWRLHKWKTSSREIDEIELYKWDRW